MIIALRSSTSVARSPELKIGEPYFALALRADDAGRGGRGGVRRAHSEEIAPTDHAFTCGTPRSASAIFSAGYS
jgi:hypothetical protein